MNQKKLLQFFVGVGFVISSAIFGNMAVASQTGMEYWLSIASLITFVFGFGVIIFTIIEKIKE